MRSWIRLESPSPAALLRNAAMLTLALGGAPLLACGGSDTVEQRSASALSTTEAQSLAFTREEEKLARDVYAALEAKEPIFSTIKSSEQTHMDAILTLLSRYGLRDPAAEKAPGVFEDATLQKLHDDLIAQGAPSTLAALQVGVAIEELDIRDIEAARSSVSHTTSYDLRQPDARLPQPPSVVLRKSEGARWFVYAAILGRDHVPADCRFPHGDRRTGQVTVAPTPFRIPPAPTPR